MMAIGRAEKGTVPFFYFFTVAIIGKREKSEKRGLSPFLYANMAIKTLTTSSGLVNNQTAFIRFCWEDS